MGMSALRGSQPTGKSLALLLIPALLGSLTLPPASVQWWEPLALVVVAILLGHRSIRSFALPSTGERFIFPLQWGLIFVATLYVGYPLALSVLLVGTFLSFGKTAFTTIPNKVRGAISVNLASLVAGAVFASKTRTGSPFQLPADVPQLLTAGLCYWAVISIAESWPGNLSRWQDWLRFTIRHVEAGVLALISLLTLTSLLLFGFETNLGVALLVFTPFLILTHQAYLLGQSRSQEREKHIAELRVKQAQLSDLYLATIKSLALAIDAKDQYTHQHILRVQRYSEAIAKQLGLKGDDYEAVSTGALLHDIGKLGVPEYVLLKPGRLTPDEFAKIKLHPEIGAAILEPVPFPWPVLPAVKYHHERWDGLGYPEGLAGENIPLIARILSVADVYDALTSTRSYRTAWSHEKARQEIEESRGTQFDPVVVAAFLEVIDGVVAEMASEGEGPLAKPSDAQAKRANDPSTEVARQISRASSDLWALYEVAQSLSTGLGMRESLEILGRKLQAAFPGSTCCFLTRDREEEQLTVNVSLGANLAFLQQSKTLNSASQSWQVLTSRASYRGEYQHDDLLLNTVSDEPWQLFQSSMIVPVVYDGLELGTVNLYHPDLDQFDDQDQQLLETIAESLGMALFNFLHTESTEEGEFDPLTETHNAKFFTRILQERTADKGLLDLFSILVLDIDGFRPINEVFGHRSGDEVLQKVTRIVEECAGNRGTIARYGGDEFVVVLDEVNIIEAHEVKDSIKRSVESADFNLTHDRIGDVRISVSIGVATFPLDGSDFTMLMATAERSMKREKSEARLRSMALPITRSEAA